MRTYVHNEHCLHAFYREQYLIAVLIMFQVIERNLLLSLVPNSETQCSSSMALAALRLLIDNNSSSPCLAALKESMRVHGVLDAICDQMVFSWNQCSTSLASPVEGGEYWTWGLCPRRIHNKDR